MLTTGLALGLIMNSCRAHLITKKKMEKLFTPLREGELAAPPLVLNPLAPHLLPLSLSPYATLNPDEIGSMALIQRKLSLRLCSCSMLWDVLTDGYNIRGVSPIRLMFP